MFIHCPRTYESLYQSTKQLQKNTVVKMTQDKFPKLLIEKGTVIKQIMSVSFCSHSMKMWNKVAKDSSTIGC